MKVKNIAMMLFSIAFGITCFVWGVLWMVMAKDLKEQVEILENENQQLKWQNNYVYCE